MTQNIKHIVYLMLENRSLDNVLGWLYADTGNKPTYNYPAQKNPTYNGLLQNTYFNYDANGTKHWVTKGTNGYMNVPSLDPYEEYEHVNNQLFENMATPVPPYNPTIGGFYKDFETFYDSPYQIMQTYTPADLPIINGLARSYAVSDKYFSSLPTQTNCNRAFAATGNSLGLDDKGVLTSWVNNHFASIWSGDPKKLLVKFNQRTIWNTFSDSGRNSPNDWMIYYSDVWDEGFCYTRDIFTQLQAKKFDNHFDNIDTFFSKAKNGTLPFFSFLEPEWGLKMWHIGTNGNDYHPPCNLPPGEAFLWKVFTALRSNTAAWNNTLFIVNFDEHGGTYDHVKTPGNAVQPWQNMPFPGNTPKPANYEFGFQCDRYGVRVPLLLISPYINAQTVFRSSLPAPMDNLDHTSVIATILKLAGINISAAKLGARVWKAPTFEGVINRTTPRTDMIQLTPGLGKEHADTIQAPYNDLQLGMANSVLMHYAQKKKVAVEMMKPVYKKYFTKKTNTVQELSKALHDTLDELKEMTAKKTKAVTKKADKTTKGAAKKK
ncbi:MAG: alkaline phosphatase family protein [Chitinophagaceae bacterium]